MRNELQRSKLCRSLVRTEGSDEPSYPQLSKQILVAKAVVVPLDGGIVFLEKRRLFIGAFSN